MREIFESLWEGTLGRVNISKHPIILLNDDSKPVQLALYRAEPTAKRVSRVGLSLMITKEVIESATTKWADRILFSP